MIASGSISTTNAALVAGQSVGLAFGAGDAGAGVTPTTVTAYGSVTSDNFTSVHDSLTGITDLVLLSDGTTGSGVGYGSSGSAGFSNGDPDAGSGATVPFANSSLEAWSGTGPGGSFTFIFSGLDNGLTYSLQLATGAWSINDAIDGTGVTADGQNVAMGNLDTEPVYQTLTGLSTDGSGNLAVTVADGAISDAVLTAIPEPSSTALLGLGGLALILRRRK